MAIQITFPLFTDDEVLWLDKDAVNNFFNAVTVPSALTSAEGVVKKSSVASVSNTTVTMTSYALSIYDDSGSLAGTYNVTSKATGDSLIVAVGELQTQIAALKTSMVAAGQLAII